MSILSGVVIVVTEYEIELLLFFYSSLIF